MTIILLSILAVIFGGICYLRGKEVGKQKERSANLKDLKIRNEIL